MVYNGVKKLAMHMHFTDAQNKVWTLQREFCLALKSAGFGDLTETKPHIAIQHIIKRLKPYNLKSRMMDIVHWKKNENFHEEDSIALCAK